MFDIKQWLSSADISGADKSLDRDSAQLLVLNHALMDEGSGTILSSLIILSDGERGIDAFPTLAQGSEPRLASMALLNILYTLRMGRSENCEYAYSPGTGDCEDEVVLLESDLPSENYVRKRIASVMTAIASIFVDNASEGDTCPDFLTYILTILMDLSRDANKDYSMYRQLAAIPSRAFLKAIMRVWKSEEHSAHVSTSDANDGLNLGFLVTCYLRSICNFAMDSLRPGSLGLNGHRTSSREDVNDEDEPYGLHAILSMSDWFIKFSSMRLYQESCSSEERGHLVSVLLQSARQSVEFVEQLLKLFFMSTLQHCLTLFDTNFADIEGILSPTQSTDRQMALLPYMHIIDIILTYLGASALPTPSFPLGRSNRTACISSLWTCLTIVSKHSLTIVICSNPDDPNCVAASSVALHSLALAWRLNDLHFSTTPSFLHWHATLITHLNLICTLRNTSWASLSLPAQFSAVRSSVKVCTYLAQSLAQPLAQQPLPTCSHHDTHSAHSPKLCEWCLLSPTTPKLCGLCGRATYCGRPHQRAHWKSGHRVECLLSRNALQGCSFVLVDDGTLVGLQRRIEEEEEEEEEEEKEEKVEEEEKVEKEEVVVERERESGSGNASARSVLENVQAAQREELLTLMRRLPGVLTEKGGGEGGGWRYESRAQFMKGWGEGKGMRGAKALLGGKGIRICREEEGRRWVLSMWFEGYGERQRLKSRRCC